MMNQVLSMKRSRDQNIPKHMSKAQTQANSKKQMLMEKNNIDMNKQMYLQQQGQRPTKSQKNKATKEFSSLSSGGVMNMKKNKNYIHERQIFEKIKNALYTSQSGAPNSSTAQSIYNHNRCIWIETVKCMELYNSDVINKKELLGLIQFILGTNHAILFEEFKKILLCKVDDSSQVSSNIINYGPLNHSLGGLDVSKLDKCSSSYCLLPSEYDHGTFAERTAEDMKVLNNICISSSNACVNNQMYKNKYEEILLRCDEERFEMDMIIDSNKSTIDVLEPIIDEIQDFILSKERKSKYKRDKHVFQFDMDILKSVHLFAISRIYGGNGSEAIELLKKNPTAAIPVFLRRLKQKDIEWCKIRTDLTINWKELQLQNYDKSFNSKSHDYIFKEKLFYNSRSILNEVINNKCDNNGITTIDLKNIGVYFHTSEIDDIQSSFLVNTFKPNLLLTYR
jgi:histone deacetylase complex regulatory component SIN3